MKEDRSGLAPLWTFLILVVIVTVVFWGVYSVIAPDLPARFVPDLAETGDFIEIDYVGWFPGSAETPGRVFDTSIQSVARNNASFPKAASFSYRSGPGGRYEPLQFTMGCVSGTGCPLQAFQAAILGMRIGDSKTATLTPSQAYGQPVPSLVQTRELLEEVVVTETMDATEFQARYAGHAEDGAIVEDLRWGWNVTVRVSGDIITTRNSPRLGEVVRVAGRWDARVVAIDDAANGGKGAITVQHLLTASDVGAFVAEDDRGNFIVVALDPGAGTYTVDYNAEVVGKTLVFELTLKGLRKGRR
jgi:FKBP-type peptidyl-prolyl cis-trans isomerase 2